jgi:hypothetical protein
VFARHGIALAVLRRHTHRVLAQAADARGDGRIRRGDHAAVAGRDDLARVKGKAGDGAVRAADAFPAVVDLDLAAERARGVLDEGEAVLAREGEDGTELAGEAQLMDAKDRAGARAHRLGQPARVHAEGVGLDVDEHRARPHRDDRVGGGDEAVADRDHLVAGADVEGALGQLEGRGAARDRDRVGRADRGGQLAFEGCHLGALQDPAGSHDPGGGVSFWFAQLRASHRDTKDGNVGGGHGAPWQETETSDRSRGRKS